MPIKVIDIKNLSEAELRIINSKIGSCAQMVLCFLKANRDNAYTQKEILGHIRGKDSGFVLGKSTISTCLITILRAKYSPVKKKGSYYYYENLMGRPKKK